MKRRHRWARRGRSCVLWVWVLTVLSGSVGWADPFEVGSEVLPRENATFQRDGKDAPRPVIAWPLVVERVDGDWLHLEGGLRLRQADAIEAEKADAYYADFLKRNPKSPWGYVMRAAACDTRGESMLYLNEAIRLDPNFPGAHAARAQRWEFKDAKKAIADLGEAIRIDPQNGELYQERGIHWYDQSEEKDYIARAIADFSAAVKLNPLLTESYWKRAHLWPLDQPERSIADYDAMLKIKPKGRSAIMALNARADVRLRLKEYDKAFADFDAALALFADEKGIDLDLTHQKADAMRGKGKTRHEQGKYDEAVAEFTRVINETKWGGDYWSRGRSYAAKKDYAPALVDYNQALVMDFPREITLESRGELWAEQGEHKKAIADFTAALQIVPRRTSLFVLRANARLAAGYNYDALEDLAARLKDDPTDAWAWKIRSQIWRNKGQLDKEVADLTEAIRHAPHDPDAYLRRAKAQLDRGQVQPGIADLELVQEKWPDQPDAYASHARVLAFSTEARIRDGAKAVTLAQKACLLTRFREPAAVAVLAGAHAEAGDFEKAIQMQLLAIDLTKNAEALAEWEKRLALYRAGKPYRLTVEDR